MKRAALDTAATDLQAGAPHTDHVSITRIRPARGLMLPDARELWRYRHVVGALVWRNVARRYRQTLLGPVWFIISPLFRMLIFSLVLGKLAKLPSDGVPYPLFTYTALLPWELFNSGVTRSMASFVTYQHIISKIYFPRVIVPAAEIMTALVDFMLSFTILIVMALAYGYMPTARMVVLPLLLLLAMGLSLAVGLLLVSLQARYRDVSNMMKFALQFWFYGTPVAYSASVVAGRLPPWLEWLYVVNPMAGVVEGFRWALLGTGRAPDMTLAISAAFTLVLLVAGAIVFSRTEHSIVDLI